MGWFILILILAAIVSKGARNLISGVMTLLFGLLLLIGSCAIT